jgi:5-methylcytosine-specific restriction endonuclease McrA
MLICERCGNPTLHENIESHHIIPVAIIKAMKYKFEHTISNKMILCYDCHEKIHFKFRPDKFWWKKLEDRTLKMRGSKKIDALILEIREMQVNEI